MELLLLTLLHLGALHTYEQVLVAVVAVGPFVVLGVVVHILRRRDLAAERAAAPTTTAAPTDPMLSLRPASLAEPPSRRIRPR